MYGTLRTVVATVFYDQKFNQDTHSLAIIVCNSNSKLN